MTLWFSVVTLVEKQEFLPTSVSSAFTRVICSFSGWWCGALHWCSITIITNTNNLKSPLQRNVRISNSLLCFQKVDVDGVDCNLQSLLRCCECRRLSSNILESVCYLFFCLESVLHMNDTCKPQWRNESRGLNNSSDFSDFCYFTL